MRSLLRFYKRWKEKVYVSKVSHDAPWAYVSYISDPFYHIDDKAYMESHQNKKETIAIVSIFNDLGYNVYVQEYTSSRRLPKIDAKIIFGHEPNFEKAARKYPGALKVYYATGAAFEHQNNQVIRMTDFVNRKYGANLPYRRMVTPHNAYSIADRILLIGSQKTIGTFPEEFRDKIHTIHQSSQLVSTSDSVSYAPQNEFFFMGSTGNMLRGLPILFDYFILHPELVLNVVGPIEEDFYNLVKEELTDNIRFYGFMEVNSPEMMDVVSRCNFMIYPSGSEGCPGSVLNSMKLGLIPIVTPWAAFDEIEEYGFEIQSWDVEGISAGVSWALSLSKEKIESLKKECRAFVESTFNMERFKEEFKDFFLHCDEK